MTPRNYSSEGIILARKNYSEADRILIIFSKDYGKLSLIAKGVRRLKSRKRAHIEIFNRIKFSASHGKTLDLMTEAEIIDSLTDIKNNLKKVSLAYYFAEVVGRSTREGEKNSEIYEELINFLVGLRRSSNLKKLRYEFVTSVLIKLGFWPEGKKLVNPDRLLEEVLERTPSSVRVGIKMLQ
jgi:DNA repair protein RecO (recombination protein O)